MRGIEIGVFEGRSTLWFLDNVLQHESSSLTCIEPNCEESFFINTSGYLHKIQLLQKRSAIALKDSSLTLSSFNFIYVDGDHSAPSVLEDAILSFPLLARRGILIFDDYNWRSSTPEISQSMPKLAIDAFLDVYKGQYDLLYRGYQVAIRRL